MSSALDLGAVPASVADRVECEGVARSRLAHLGASNGEIEEVLNTPGVSLAPDALGATLAVVRADIAIRVRKRRARWRSALADAGVPERHLRSVFDSDPVTTPALSALRSWKGDGTRSMLVLCGPPSVGKSGAMACAFVPANIDTDVPGIGRWVAAAELSRLAGFEHAAAWTALERAPLLAIDDLGLEGGSAWARECVVNILTSRYDNARPTVLSANLKPAEISERLGPRIAERMAEAADVVIVKGRNLRRGNR